MMIIIIITIIIIIIIIIINKVTYKWPKVAIVIIKIWFINGVDNVN